MKRILIVAMTAAALAVPAIALGAVAGVAHFGHLAGDPGSPVKFKEVIADDQRQLTTFNVRNFEVACDDGILGSLKVVKLAGKVEVSPDGVFKVANDNGKTVFKVKGQIRRNKATGTFRYFGKIPADDGVTRDCDTGKLGWVTRP